jgi:glutamyl-Q tRNA(Asp) synthetase
MSCKKVERFAPSPTGPLHLGHAFSALTAARHADRFLLRMEDIDTARCRPEWEAAILDDLRWLGMTWQEPVLRQSERLHLYREFRKRQRGKRRYYHQPHPRRNRQIRSRYLGRDHC